MIENRIDIERTRAARKSKEFVDRRSYYNLAGHVFLRGHDRSIRRLDLMCHFGMICQICKKEVLFWDADYEHIVGGSKHRRCDCFYTKLADGSIHTNVQLVHGMFSKMPCHRRKHHREVKR